MRPFLRLKKEQCRAQSDRIPYRRLLTSKLSRDSKEGGGRETKFRVP